MYKLAFHTAFAAVFAIVTTGLASAQPTTTGTWQLYPEQALTYATTVQQPINTDGTSNFKFTGKSVIPIKFSLATAPGPVIFQSIGSDTSTDNDFSFASFTPISTLTFAGLSNLSTVYTFTEGDCHGGSLRWQVRTSPNQAVYIYYGVPPNFGNGGDGGCTPTSTGGANQSGLSILNLAGARFDLTQYGGPFYGTYSDALTAIGSLPITRVSLVLDSGWQNAPLGDQVINPIVNPTVNDNTFVPLSGSSQTCNLPPATIQVTQLSGSPTGPVNEPLTIQPADNDSQFRVVDCKYMYNLATTSLPGTGRYKVEVVIGGTPAAGAAYFDLR
jgi:hypothetical protein